MRLSLSIPTNIAIRYLRTLYILINNNTPQQFTYHYFTVLLILILD